MKKEAELFKILGDPTRLRLAVLLAVHGETCVCHLAFALDEPDYKVSRHLAVMRSAGLVEARREGTWMYYRLSDPKNRFEKNLEDFLKASLAGHPVVKSDCERISRAICELKSSLTKKENQKIKVLFLCTGNSCRSQMAEGFARAMGGPGVVAVSAGTMRAQVVAPKAVQVMAELGIDISQHEPKGLTEEMLDAADAVFVMGCDARDYCPAVWLQDAVDWDLEDPMGQGVEKYREVRDLIRHHMEGTLRKKGIRPLHIG